MSEQDLTDNREKPVLPDPGEGGDRPHSDSLIRDTRDGEAEPVHPPMEQTAAPSPPGVAGSGGEEQLTDHPEITRAPEHRDDGSPGGLPPSRHLRDSFRHMGPWLLVVAFLFALAMIGGVIVAIRDPSIGTTLMNIFRETILGGIDESNPFSLALAIFLNNLQACLLLFLGGASFGILTVFILGSNGLVIGAVLELVRQEKGTLFVIAAILPHGLLEIPAFLISGALGLMLARSLWREWHGLEDAAEAATRSGRLFITVVVPVVVLAAFIEAFITPQIIDLLI